MRPAHNNLSRALEVLKPRLITACNITGKTLSRINIGRKYGRAVRREFRGAATKFA